MTNLFLSIALLTNTDIVSIKISGLQTNHLYTLQYASGTSLGSTLWERSWIFTSSDTNTTMYDYVFDTNRLYRVVDQGSLP